MRGQALARFGFYLATGAIIFMAITVATGSMRASGPQPLAFGIVGRSMADVVEQESPDWIYPDNGYNQWQCTHDGTFDEYQAGGGVVTADSCVHNPTLCVWDVDDVNDGAGTGYLNAGASATGTLCGIADGHDNAGGDDKHFEVDVYAPSAYLNVAMTDNLGHQIIALPRPEGNGFIWPMCYWEHEIGPWDTIANSNGGTGRLLTWTATVTATRKVNSISVYMQTYGWLNHYTPRC